MSNVRWPLGVATTGVRRVVVLSLALLGFGLATSHTVSATTPPDKVFVCKYVGTPGVDEQLQTGDNPISVSVSATGGAEVGSFFADGQNRSFVLAVDDGQEEPPVREDCPPPEGPTTTTTTTIAPTTTLATSTTTGVTLPPTGGTTDGTTVLALAFVVVGVGALALVRRGRHV